MVTGTAQRNEAVTKADFGKEPSATVNEWLARNDKGTKVEIDWRTDARSCIEIYRDEWRWRSGGQRRHRGRRPFNYYSIGVNDVSFNILYSNTETLLGGLYQHTPRPVVKRRYGEAFPIARVAAQVLERCLTASLDQYDFDYMMEGTLRDYLLTGRGLPRVMYEPVLGTDPQTGAEAIMDQRVYAERWPWDTVRFQPSRQWGEKGPGWIIFYHGLTRAELVRRWPGKGEKVAMDWDPNKGEKSKRQKEEQEGVYDLGTVWECWDRERGQVIYIAPSLTDAPLEVLPEPPLDLADFYPIPRPIYSIPSTESLVPRPEFMIYADQAKELDWITKRISRLINALKVRGLYDQNIGEMEQIFNSDDNAMIPAQNMAGLYDRGGLDRSIWMLPLEKLIQVLTGLYHQRNEIKQTIYEITGISDIFRGATKASESATAQSIKAQVGSLRFDRRQHAVQRMARDVMRLKAEIIAEEFTEETLRRQSGVELPDELARERARQQVAQLQQAQQEVPPELQQTADSPSWREVVAFLRTGPIRDYRIDVETDYTIASDQQADREAITRLLTAITQFLQATPILAQAGMPIQAMKALLLAGVRRHRMGREVEDALNAIPDNPRPQPSPEEMRLQAEAQQKQAELQLEQESLAIEKEKAATDRFKAETDRMKALDERAEVAQSQTKQAELALEAQRVGIEKQNADTNRLKVETDREKAAHEIVAKERETNSQATDQAVVVSLSDTIGAVSDSLAQASANLAAAADRMSAPKRVVRDDQGNVVGVEPVTMEAAE